ncbi:MAG: zinc ribbon domain-containing protein [Solirubrobacteraceae bacterium]
MLPESRHRSAPGGRRDAPGSDWTVCMMATLAVLGIESTSLTIFFDILIIFAVIVYVALVYWTYNDAQRRILDPTLVGCATAVALVPFVGPLVYLIVRPVETLEDAQEREMELEATKLRLYELESGLCPHCDYPIERDFLRCPSCLRSLKERCHKCERPLDRAWTICPYCESEVPAPTVRRTRAGSRRAGHETTPAAPAATKGAAARSGATARTARDHGDVEDEEPAEKRSRATRSAAAPRASSAPAAAGSANGSTAEPAEPSPAQERSRRRTEARSEPS